jgi:SAM-dependent methyltransferase
MMDKSKYNWFDIRRWELLLKYYEGGRLIDLGSYDSLLPYMAKIKYLSKMFPKTSVCEIYKIDWISQELKVKDNFFDYVTAGQVIEHLEKPTPQELVKEVHRVLKPGGVFALSCPYKETERGEVDINHHWKGITEKDIANLLKDFKRIKIKIIGSNYLPYKYNFEHLICYAWK